MIIIYCDYLDLDKIANSGQCFRWKKISDNGYEIPAFGKILHVKPWENPHSFELDCTQKEYDRIWKDYFDMDDNIYAKIDEMANTERMSEYLYNAIKFSKGIRILKQDLWETTVSFIISQNNNIPRIKSSIEKLCYRYNADGSFPSPYQILTDGSDKLENLGLGYRDKYIFDAAYRFLNCSEGQMLSHMTYIESRMELMTFKGIGPKVADCICLYGLNHKEAFPRDVWVKRIEQEHFGGHFPDEDHPGYAGALQQYMFYHERNKEK